MIIFGILGILCLIAAGGILFTKYYKEEQWIFRDKWFLGFLFMSLILFVLTAATVQIEAGHVGVVKNFGAVSENKFYPGLHFIIPVVQSVEVYRTQQVIYETSDNPETSQANFTDFSVDTMTEDGQRIKVRFTVVLHIDPTKADWVAQNIGTEADVIEKVVKANARSEARNIPKSFKASDLYGENVYACQRAIFNKLEPIFAINGVILNEFLLRDIGFDENLAEALEAKQIALEQQVTAARMVDVKTAEANQLIASAKGTAQAEIEKAKGQAEAIRLINEQLARAGYYNEYLLAKGIAEGTTDIQWIVPEGSMPILDLAGVTNPNPAP